jgi:hypothetical protein
MLVLQVSKLKLREVKCNAQENGSLKSWLSGPKFLCLETQLGFS